MKFQNRWLTFFACMAAFVWVCGVDAQTKPAAQRFVFSDLEDEFSNTAELPAYVKDSLKTFSVFTLKNGIPVVVKKNTSNRIQYVSLLIRRAEGDETPETAGITSLMLHAMERGSADADNDAIKALLDATTSEIESKVEYDSARYGLRTFDKYFSRLLPVWARTITKPRFDAAEFEKVKSLRINDLKSAEQDPWQIAMRTGDESFFDGHLYSADPQGTVESLGNISLDQVKAHYKKMFAQGRISIVAVGNFDANSVRSTLEKAFSALDFAAMEKSGSIARPAPLEARSKLVKKVFPGANDVGYMLGYFPAPNFVDPDYLPMRIGGLALSGLLFYNIRTLHGLAYTPDIAISNAQANYARIIIYKSQMLTETKKYVDESINILRSGKALVATIAESDAGAKTSEPFGNLELIMAGAKRQIVGQLFNSQQTNSGNAELIEFSIINANDYRAYLLYQMRADAVTAQQVIEAVNRWIDPAAIEWIALGPAKIIDAVDEKEFLAVQE